MANKFTNAVLPFLSKHEPEILTGLGLSGMIFSTIYTAKATIKAVDAINKKEIEEGRKLTKKEVFKTVWKYYIPSLLSTIGSSACIIGSTCISNKRSAALAAAYTISETALQEYQNKTLELVGEKKEKDIHEAVSKDVVEKTYTGTNIILTGDGDSLFYEPLSGRYFKSNWNKILKAANELNANALNDFDGTITLTQWYSELGLDKTDISDEMGWSLERGVKGLISISIDSSLTPDDMPCGAIYYVTRPIMLENA